MEQKKVEPEKHYERCADCGIKIPEMTYDRFGVCLDCYHKRYPPDKVESPDVPKEYFYYEKCGEYLITNGNRILLSAGENESVVNNVVFRLNELWKELADLRAERDKLKENFERVEKACVHFKATRDEMDQLWKESKADNERLKEGYNKLIEMCIAHICSSPYMPEYGPISIPVKKVREELELALKSYLENK